MGGRRRFALILFGCWVTSSSFASFVFCFFPHNLQPSEAKARLRAAGGEAVGKFMGLVLSVCLSFFFFLSSRDRFTLVTALSYDFRKWKKKGVDVPLCYMHTML